MPAILNCNISQTVRILDNRPILDLTYRDYKREVLSMISTVDLSKSFSMTEKEFIVNYLTILSTNPAVTDSYKTINIYDSFKHYVRLINLNLPNESIINIEHPNKSGGFSQVISNIKRSISGESISDVTIVNCCFYAFFYNIVYQSGIIEPIIYLMTHPFTFIIRTLMDAFICTVIGITLTSLLQRPGFIIINILLAYVNMQYIVNFSIYITR